MTEYRKYEIYTHTHYGILLSHKREWNLSICSNVDELDGIMLSEISRERQKFHLHTESQKQMNKHKTETELWTQRTTGVCQR